MKTSTSKQQLPELSTAEVKQINGGLADSTMPVGIARPLPIFHWPILITPLPIAPIMTLE